MDRYTVVEHAGYERENEVKTFDSYEEALTWRARNYSSVELETCHVEIRLDRADGTQEYFE
jgi:hypothetical protein